MVSDWRKAFARELSQGLHRREPAKNGDQNTAQTVLEAQFNRETAQRLERDGLDHNAISNLAKLLDEQCEATGTILRIVISWWSVAGMKAEIGASSSIHHMVGACMSLGR